MSLRIKLLVPIIALVIVVMAGTSWFSYLKSSDALEASIIQAGKLELISLDQTLNVTFATALTNVQDLAMQPTIRKAIDLDSAADPKAVSLEISARLKQFTDSFAIYQGAAVINKKGVIVAFSTPASIGQNYADRPYFGASMRGENVISDVVQSRSSGTHVSVVSTPLRSDAGEIVGVVFLTVDMHEFAARYLDTLQTDTTLPYLLTRNGLIAAHPNRKLILDPSVADNPVFKKFVAMNDGSDYYDWQGHQRLGIVHKNKATGMSIVIAGDVDKLFAPVTSMRNLSLAALGVGLVVLVCVIVLLLNAMIRALGQGVRFADAVAAGRLDERYDYESKDEIGALATALRAMVGKLKEMILASEQKTREAEEQSRLAAEATKRAEEARIQAEGAKREGMLQAAAKLEGVVEIISSAAEQLSAQIEQSDRGAVQQSARVNETAVAMDEMNSTVLEVAKNAGATAEVSNDARKKAEEGAAIVREVIAGIGAVQQQSQAMKSDMGELGKQAENIGQILNVISDIADQTNLLALNAAIEAARAGEAGRGFAVVADEVRKLAEKTMSATSEVGASIQGIQNSAAGNIQRVGEAARSAGEATDLAGTSGEALHEIVQLAGRTSALIAAIATAAEEQSSTSEEINRAVEEINTIAGETSSGMDQSAAAVRELSRMAQELKLLLDKLRG